MAQYIKNLPADAGDARDLSLIPGSGRSPGEGNGNPLQCSCLENPRDGGAWWAAIYGVAQSRTRLKRLSSSSSSKSKGYRFGCETFSSLLSSYFSQVPSAQVLPLEVIIGNALLLLLLLSRFSRVQLCATPWTAAHQAPPSLGFSRQEHWSGLPFPSPMHEREK